MFQSLATMIGGLGLFFAGVWFLGENLKRAAGRRFRQAVIARTRHASQGFAWGALFGAITLSMPAMVFILMSMLTAGLIGVRTALPVIAGANVGGPIMILVATLDIGPAMFILVGATGIALRRPMKESTRVLVEALFGLGLLFVGIDLLRDGAVPLVQQPWAGDLLRWSHDSYGLGFLVGALLAMLAQSSGVIVITAVTLAGSGALGADQAIMTIYGSNFGSGMLTLLLAWGARGRPMQIAIFQAALNVLACLILIPLFYIELYGGVPLVKHLVESLASNVATQMACVPLLFNLLGATMVLSIRADTLLERFWPPGEAEHDAQLRYIQDRALGEPDMALDLVALEQRRLITRLPRFFEVVRKSNGGRTTDLGILHSSYQVLAGQVAEFLQEIGRTNPSSATYLRLNDFLNNQRVVQSAEATLNDLTRAICGIASDSALAQISTTLSEALDAVLLTLNHVLEEGDEFDKHQLQNITGDRGEVFQRLRDIHLSEHKDLSAGEKIQLLEITNATERVLWMLGELKVDALTVATTGDEAL